MSYVQHHAIIVTSFDTNEIAAAHAKAVELGMLVSPLTQLGGLNGYRHFAVFPDGSKEGWPESAEGDRQRRELVTWMQARRHADGSNDLQFVEMSYGDAGFTARSNTRGQGGEAQLCDIEWDGAVKSKRVRLKIAVAGDDWDWPAGTEFVVLAESGEKIHVQAVKGAHLNDWIPRESCEAVS